MTEIAIKRPGRITFVFVVNIIMLVGGLALGYYGISDPDAMRAVMRATGHSAARIRQDYFVGVVISLVFLGLLIGIMNRQNWARWLYVIGSIGNFIYQLAAQQGMDVSRAYGREFGQMMEQSINTGIIIALGWLVLEISLLCSARSNDYFRGAIHAGAVPPPLGGQGGSTRDRLTQLESLLEQGIINAEEYNQTRTKILDEM